MLIPRALPGIISGVILSIGRCAEDTAVIMLTGVVATAGVPHSIFGGYEALFQAPETYEKVTVEDIRRVVETYFRKSNRTVGILKKIEEDE